MNKLDKEILNTLNELNDLLSEKQFIDASVSPLTKRKHLFIFQSDEENLDGLEVDFRNGFQLNWVNVKRVNDS